MNPSSFARMLGPNAFAPPTDLQFIKKADLLLAAGITSRQLRYFIQMGAVARPIGKSRHAQYTVTHLQQAKRVAWELQTTGRTVAEIAEIHAKRTPGVRPAKQEPKVRPSTGETSITYRLTEGVSVVVRDRLLPTETQLLRKLLKVGTLSLRERLRMTQESLTMGAVSRKSVK